MTLYAPSHNAAPAGLSSLARALSAEPAPTRSAFRSTSSAASSSETSRQPLPSPTGERLRVGELRSGMGLGVRLLPSPTGEGSGVRPFLLLLLLLLSSCVSELDGPRHDSATAQGTFSLGLTADALDVEVETRTAVPLTDAEAANFLVTLTQDGEPIWQRKAYKDITTHDCTQPLGTGYVIQAENVTEAEAESSNDGWGCRRYAGESEPFAVVADQTTHVTVPCQMVNAGFTVAFDDAFTSFFTDYAVVTDDLRSLRFSNTSAQTPGSAQSPGQPLPIAFYNIPSSTGFIPRALPSGSPEGSPSGVLPLPLLITAAAGWDGSLRIARTVNLYAGKIVRLNVKLSGTEPTQANVVLSVTYDDSFAPGASHEITLE